MSSRFMRAIFEGRQEVIFCEWFDFDWWGLVCTQASPCAFRKKNCFMIGGQTFK